MEYQLNLSSTNIAFLQRYLPQLTATLNQKLEGDTLFTNREALENLQKALSEVLMTYGFDENYDAMA